MAFSNAAGETLTLPSPTHAHNVDVTSTVRTLRRSLSRSPSRFSLLRTTSESSDGSVTSRSPTPAASSPRRLITQQQKDVKSPGLASVPLSPQPANITTPFKPGVKLSVRSAKSRLATPKSVPRSRGSPKSSLKRLLGLEPNPEEALFPASDPDQENSTSFSFVLGLGTTSRRSLDKPSRHSVHLDLSGISRTSSPKLLDAKTDALISTASPLKRSDALMSLDQTNPGSPKAKRRSLHGVGIPGGDVSIFEDSRLQESFNIHEDGNGQDCELAVPAASSIRELLGSSTSTAMPRRSSSLRKKTLQQRTNERSAWERRAGEGTAGQSLEDVASPAPKARPRLSLDQYLPPGPHDSPFSSVGNLPNPSAHPMDRQSHQPHPLSRSLTQSSSSSSVMEDSPTHIPVPIRERPRAVINFSKSLPPGAPRPTEDSAQTLATPKYKSAIPNQAAFMSTGLVSKKNWNLQQGVPRPSDAGAAMPDTPCKKQVYPSNTYPPQSGSGRRQSRPSFGSPSTPFNPLVGGSANTFGAVGRGSSLFKQFRPSHTRKASILSTDGDDHGEAQSIFENELPPTPTKHVLSQSLGERPRAATSPAAQPIGLPTSAVGQRDDNMFPHASSSPLDHLGYLNTSSPTTPQGLMKAPDPVVLSSSKVEKGRNSLPAGETKPSRPPATPTTHGRGSFMDLGRRRPSMTPANGQAISDIDESLLLRFDKSEAVGHGEFSQVFRVVKYARPTPFAVAPLDQLPDGQGEGQVYAVKKIRLPFHGVKDRDAKFKEVEALKAVRMCDHVVHIVDSWEHNFHLYIQTDYCEEGSLEGFLKTVGESGRLDDFRIWKILLEASLGLAAIHDAGFIHLDVKPANIFISFEGILKIGDFGMATRWPARKGIDGEGDREYMGPEILNGMYDKPADIFSLGLVLLETACNVFLPDNGPTWQALRDGDLSVVPSLTWTDASSVIRDATGTPITHNSVVSPLNELQELETGRALHASTSQDEGFPFNVAQIIPTHQSGDLFGGNKRAELQNPPDFMADSNHPGSLDNVARWMLRPNPGQRPTARQLVCLESLAWVSARRRAGATVFEGNWGPEDEALADIEMTDV